MDITRTLKTGIFCGGLALLAGCDTDQNVELVQREYDGKATITLTQKITYGNFDSYSLEVRDSTGIVIASMQSSFTDAQLKIEDSKGHKTYDLSKKGFVSYTPKD